MAENATNTRLEAFCDGVFAIAITLLVIDIRIPSNIEVNTTADLWSGLRHTLPSVSAFLLSFCVILITWVNHHSHMVLVSRSCGSFLYANGFLLLTVAFIPFPTSLLGEFLLTDHASPAVVLYNAVLAFQAIGWILISHTALDNHLEKNEKAGLAIRKNLKFGFFAFLLYSILAILAIWFPLTVAIVTTLSWLFWLIHGIRLNRFKSDKTEA